MTLAPSTSYRKLLASTECYRFRPYVVVKCHCSSPSIVSRSPRRSAAFTDVSVFRPFGPADASSPRSPTSPLRDPRDHSPHRSVLPLLTEHLCDPRLGQFEVFEWLQTPVPSEFAARAVSFYLVTDHPVHGLFDADLFLSDLAAHKTEFCSPLLLSAVLSSACVRTTLPRLKFLSFLSSPPPPPFFVLFPCRFLLPIG